jgi:outer membrane beta-barrel protein
MTLRTRLAAAVSAALTCAALPSVAAAQNKADAFAGKIPPVSGQLYRKTGRLEVTPTANISLNDAFFTKYFGGLKVGYHFTESFAASLHGAGGAAVQTGSAVRCTSRECTDATEDMLRQVPGRIRWLAGAEVAWSPVYGKLNVFSEQVAHFDLSVFAGPALVAYDEVLAEAEAASSPGMKTSFGGHFGIGARLFFTPWIAARLEVKDYVYAVKVPNAGSGNDWQNQFFAELGVSFFLPSRNRALR